MSRTDPQLRPQRPCLLPAILGAAAALIGVFSVGSDAYLFVRYSVSILALIVVVYAVQNRAWLWLVPLLGIAVLWNPVFPLEFRSTWWLLAHLVAASALLAAGVFIRTRRERGTEPVGGAEQAEERPEG